jgi:signal transduction histidine kinase
VKPRIPLAAEVVLAYCAAAAFFTLVAVSIASSGSDVLVLALGVVYVAAVVAMVHWWGVAYGVAAAMAGLLAYDWFYFPPTHAHEFPDRANLADIVIYIGVAVLVGELASYAGRRADDSEVARIQLVDEQSALRRVATLVAQNVAPEELFAAVTEEVGRLLETDLASMVRYEIADTLTVVAAWDAAAEPAPVAQHQWIESEGTVGAPIVVDGRAWGALLVHSTQRGTLPADTESRLENFTELVGTAMANAGAREEVRRLAEEQAALRRVATLVARESSPDEVFAAVTEEVGRLMPIEDTTMFRFEDDNTVSVVAEWGERDVVLNVGTRLSLEGDNVTTRVLRTGRPARMDDYTQATGSIGDYARDTAPVRSAIGIPIVVDGQLWGALAAASRQPAPMPEGTESRIAKFTELVATAIANVQARADLAASRARIVDATDEERRRVVRDLHDGAQQRLVHTVITLKLARQAIERSDAAAPALVAEALDQAQQATAELRELAHGILPAVLSRGGLRAGVHALASRTPVPVDVGVSVGRLPPAVESTAYFMVAEALTNVAKHAHAGRAEVTARVEDGTLRVQVRDDGVGGARPDGTGLVGLTDRLAVLDGQLRVESPADGGTLVAATIPLSDRSAVEA